MTVLLASLPDAAAHRDDQSYLYLDIGVGVQARLQMPFGDIETALGIDISGTDNEVEQLIAENADTLIAYAADHVTLEHPTKNGTWWLARHGEAPMP